MIWIIGAGTIAQEYAKVLTALGYQFQMIGRGEEKARQVEETLGYKVIRGGLDSYIESTPEVPEAAIVATNLGSLTPNTLALLKYGVKRILCEKPGFLYPEECEKVAALAKGKEAEVYLAYNRRFFSSVLKAKEIIAEDGGVTSFNFEFTEWGHVVSKYNKPQDELKNWFFANSSHVVDLAFLLGGEPVQMDCHTSGEISWHKPAAFAGSGLSDKGALFSYQANWAAPGRWGVELLTAQHRLYLRPMESLQIQNLGSVAINPVEIDDHLDKEFKPGFYLETKSFLEGHTEGLCGIQEQKNHIDLFYSRIMGEQKRVLFVTSSVGLARKQPEITLYEDTYVAIVAKKYKVFQYSQGGGIISDIVDQVINYHTQCAPDIIILHVGRVDCAPRAYTFKEEQFFQLCKFTRGIRKLLSLTIGTRKIRNIRQKAFTTKEDFEKNCNRLKEAFPNAKVYAISIFPPSEAYEKKVPGLTQRSLECNDLLRRCFGNNFIDIDDIPPSGVMSDYQHFNEEGHRFIADRILEKLETLDA